MVRLIIAMIFALCAFTYGWYWGLEGDEEACLHHIYDGSYRDDAEAQTVEDAAEIMRKRYIAQEQKELDSLLRKVQYLCSDIDKWRPVRLDPMS